MLKDTLFFVLFLIFGVTALFEAIAITFLISGITLSEDTPFIYQNPALVFLAINFVACSFMAMKCWSRSLLVEAQQYLYQR